MRMNFKTIGRMLLVGAAALVTLLSGAWGALALWYQVPGGVIVRTTGSAL